MTLEFSVDRKTATTLSQQLYLRIRELIDSGKWPRGHRLPPTRDLADELGITRKTVKHAYDQLIIEGYLEARGRQGTFVRELSGTVDPEVISSAGTDVLSSYGREVASMVSGQLPLQKNIEISLFSRFPDFENLPENGFTAAINRELRKTESVLLNDVGNSLGHRQLREAIASTMAPQREIRCTADQVAIVPGFSVVLDLITRIHVDRGDCVLVEEPCYPAMRENAIAYGARWRGLPVDEWGLLTEQLPAPQIAERWKLAFTTPGHHFPTGSVLTLERRQSLLRWAVQTGAYIVEDDYDSEFTYRGQPPPALKSLDSRDRVIYVSSFKKLVPPGLSVDYIILPRKLVAVYRQAMELSVTQTAMRTQAVLSRFITDGQMFRHVKCLKPIYARRRQLWMEAFQRHFGDSLTVHGENSGLHFLIRIATTWDADVLVGRALALGVEISHTRDFYAGVAPQGEFIIGFGCVSEDMIDEGARRLKQAFAG